MKSTRTPEEIALIRLESIKKAQIARKQKAAQARAEKEALGIKVYTKKSPENVDKNRSEKAKLAWIKRRQKQEQLPKIELNNNSDAIYENIIPSNNVSEKAQVEEKQDCCSSYRKSYKKEWDEVLKQFDSFGISGYSVGTKLFGKNNYRQIYANDLKVCRCMYEDLLSIVEECKKENARKEEERKQKEEERKQKEEKENLPEMKLDTHVDGEIGFDDKQTYEWDWEYTDEETSVEETKALLSVEEFEKEITDLQDNAIQDLKEESNEDMSLEKWFAPVMNIVTNVVKEEPIIENKQEENVLLFERLSETAFKLDNMCYIMDLRFEIMNGNQKAQKGDCLMVVDRRNNKEYPYILSVKQFLSWKDLDKISYWFVKAIPFSRWTGGTYE